MARQEAEKLSAELDGHPSNDDALKVPISTPDGPQSALAGMQRTHGWHRGVAEGLLVGAVVWWLLALQDTDLHRLSGFGLLSALPLTYYGALLLLAAGFTLAISERVVSPYLLAAYAVTLAVVLHGTTAALYPEPRYTWMYKHLGVIDYIRLHGAVHRDIDIYHNWPGFFALNAWFEKAAGRAPISYAAWAQVFFELFNVAALLFAIRGLTRDVRLQWMTVWIFLVANWVAQDYLAPQALAFPLVLVVLGICLRSTPASVRTQTGMDVFRRRWLDRLLNSEPESGEAHAQGPLSPRAALMVGALCYLAVVVTHQLSPIMLIFGLTAFALFTGRLPPRILVAMSAFEVLWIALGWPFLSKHFTLFSFDLFPNARPKGESLAKALPGVSVVARMAQAAVVAMVLLAIAGIIRRRRWGRVDVAALAFLVSPVPAAFLQSYGGEILFRTYLFALPWLAFFAAVACLPAALPRANRILGSWRFVGATCVIGTAFLFAYFGLEKINYVSRDDVAAVNWYERNAPSGSVMAYAAPGLPDRIAARYAKLRILGNSYVPQLSDVPAFRKHRITSRDIPEVISFLRGARAPHTYLAVTPSEENFARLYGIMPAGSLVNLVRVLRTSPAFRLVYRHGRAFIFELQPRRT